MMRLRRSGMCRVDIFSVLYSPAPVRQASSTASLFSSNSAMSGWENSSNSSSCRKCSSSSGSATDSQSEWRGIGPPQGVGRHVNIRSSGIFWLSPELPEPIEEGAPFTIAAMVGRRSLNQSNMMETCVCARHCSQSFEAFQVKSIDRKMSGDDAFGNKLYRDADSSATSQDRHPSTRWSDDATATVRGGVVRSWAQALSNMLHGLYFSPATVAAAATDPRKKSVSKSNYSLTRLGSNTTDNVNGMVDGIVHVCDPPGVDLVVATMASKQVFAGSLLSPELWKSISLNEGARQTSMEPDGRNDEQELGQVSLLLEHKVKAKRSVRQNIVGAKCSVAALNARSNLLPGTSVGRPTVSFAGISKRYFVTTTVMETSGGELGVDRNIASFRRAKPSGDDGSAQKNQESANVIALRCLSFAESSKAAELRSGAISSSPSSTSLPASDADNDEEVTDEFLRARVATLPARVVLDAVQRAWTLYAHGDGMETANLGRYASLALYEAGVDTGIISADSPWGSTGAGVLDLSVDVFLQTEAAGPCALNVVLRDMRRRYAYEMELAGHVHCPSIDLLIIVCTGQASTILSRLDGFLWLLENRFSDFGNGSSLHPPELCTPHGLKSELGSSKPLLSVSQVVGRSKDSGIVLYIPSRKLQKWLFAEGRAWRDCDRDNDSSKWSPPWLSLNLGDLPVLSSTVQPDA